MAGFSEEVEKILQEILETVPRFFTALFLVSFRPSRLAYRAVTDASTLSRPQTFLALSTYVFSKSARIAIFTWLLSLTSCTRSCSGNTYDEAQIMSDFWKTQLTWPTTEELLTTAVPIVLFVLALSWRFGRIRDLKSGRTPSISYITLALCYVVGAQCLLVLPIAAVAAVVAAAAAGFALNSGGIALVTLPVAFALVLVVWPCCLYYRFLRCVYTLRADQHIGKPTTKLLLVSTGLLGTTLPMIAAFAITYPRAKND